MKAGWETKALGTLCDILDNQRKPITKSDRTAGKYPYYGATGIKDYVEGYLFDEPLVLVGEDGAKWASGEYTAFAVAGKCWVNNHAHVLRPHRSKIDDNWLIHFLVHSDLHEFVSGLTVPKLNQGSLREILIPLPPLPEQHRIVAILDKAFDGIAKAKATAQANLQNARAVFESHLQEVFTRRGDGWAPVQIDRVCESIMDCVNKTAPKTELPTAFKMIRTTNVRHGLVSLDSVNYVTEETYRIWTRRQVPRRGDVILTREAPMGEIGMLLSDENVFLGQRLVSYRANPQKLNNRFLFYALRSGELQRQIHAFASGSTVQHMRVPDTKKLLLPLPELKTQDAAVSLLDELAGQTQHLESLYQRKIAALDELKKSLLHQAFSGAL